MELKKDMKKHMMILGAEIISSNEGNPDDSIMKLTLIPITTVRKVTTIEQIMDGGTVEDMIDTAVQHQKGQLKDVCYIGLGEWRDQKYKIGRHITLEILPDDTTGGIK